MKRKFNIKIESARYGMNTDIIYKMMTEEDGIKEIFQGRLDRLLTSKYSQLIKVNGEDAGFFNLVVEKGNTDLLFLDMGLKHKFRNLGIGKDVLEFIAGLRIEEPILAETLITNESANQAAKVIGREVYTVGDRNVYLIQKHRYDDFMNKGGLEKLAIHYEQEDNKALCLRLGCE